MHYLLVFSPSLLGTLETVFICHQTYDMFISRLGKMDLLDEIVLYDDITPVPIDY